MPSCGEDGARFGYGLPVVPEYTVKALDESTWPAFAALVERNNGIFGGCWCMGFHEDSKGTVPPKRERKLARVQAGAAHAALVFDGDDCLGWCQFGVPDEVPRIKAGRLQRARKTPTTMMSETAMGEMPMETSLVGASAAPSQAPAVNPERMPRS